MKFKIFIFLLTISVFGLSAKNTVRVRVDYNSRLNFKPEIESRLNQINTIDIIQNSLLGTTYLVNASNWENTDGISFAPIQVAYLVDAGNGKFYAGIQNESYKYKGSFTVFELYSLPLLNFIPGQNTVDMTNIHQYKIPNYTVSNFDIEVGYEFKIIEKLKLAIGLGNRVFKREVNYTTTQGNYITLSSKSSNIVNNGSGLFNHLELEYKILNNLGIYFNYKTGILNGNASYNKTDFSSLNLGQTGITNLILTNSSGWKNLINFREYGLGANIYATENYKVRISLGQNQYNYSFSETINEINIDTNQLVTLPINLVNPAKWSKVFEEKRNYISVGFEGDFDF